jgi:predicted enzyme related to lactoylglutathione lyase
MLFIRNVTFMAADPRRLADFWQAALELSERRDDEGETIIADADWSYPRLTFQKVTESDHRPRHLHLDLTANDRAAEVQRLLALGASEAGSVEMANGWTWTVMTDPAGNEFCVTDP